MSVIVFSKRTNKYLRRHSGSFRRTVGMLEYNKLVREEIINRFGIAPEWSVDNKDRYEYYRKVRQFCEDKLFNAEPGDAKIYASRGYAIASVGVTRDNWKTSKYVYKLPKHLKIHEIKKPIVYVIKPDSSSNCNDKH